jgi:hypothetical protein
MVRERQKQADTLPKEVRRGSVQILREAMRLRLTTLADPSRIPSGTKADDYASVLVSPMEWVSCRQYIRAGLLCESRTRPTDPGWRLVMVPTLGMMEGYDQRAKRHRPASLNLNNGITPG